jgi:hypothetical protein
MFKIVSSFADCTEDEVHECLSHHIIDVLATVCMEYTLDLVEMTLATEYPDVAELIDLDNCAAEYKMSDVDKKQSFDQYLLDNGDTPYTRQRAEVYLGLMESMHYDVATRQISSMYVNQYKEIYPDDDFPILVADHIRSMF